MYRAFYMHTTTHAIQVQVWRDVTDVWATVNLRHVTTLCQSQTPEEMRSPPPTEHWLLPREGQAAFQGTERFDFRHACFGSCLLETMSLDAVFMPLAGLQDRAG